MRRSVFGLRAGAVVAAMAVVAGLLGGPAAAQTAPEPGPEPGAISGSVTDAQGLPLQGVCVAVDWLLRPFADTPTVLTDVLGRYTVDDVAAGPHFVTFNLCEDPLAGHAASWWPDSPGLADAQMVFVEPAATTSGIDASLGAAAEIRGLLTDQATTQPLAGDCITAVDPETIAIVRSRTGDDGQYSLPATAPGSYTVVFSDCSAPHHSITEYYDDVSPEDVAAGQEPAVVTVAADESFVADASLAQGGAIAGAVTAAHTGRAVALACVALVGSEGDEMLPLHAALTGVSPTGERAADDRFVVPGVPAGSYRVQFLGEGCMPEGYREAWYGGAQQSSATVVRVDPGGTLEGVDAVLHPAPSIQLACLAVEYGSFRDVYGSGAHDEAIACLTGADVVTGKTATRYAPAGLVRRDQMASLLARALRALDVDLPADAADRFSDDAGNVHEPAINQMAATGIVTGIDPERYGPELPVSRAQLATLLAKTYEYATGYVLRSTRDWFTDDTASPHHGRINHAATAGIATGVARRRFDPAGNVRRDQVASFLARAMDRATRDRLHLQLGAPPEPAAEGDAAPSAMLLQMGIVSPAHWTELIAAR